MLDDLQRAALAYRVEYGAEALRRVLAPFCRPGRRIDLNLVVDRRAALIALALAQEIEPATRQQTT